MDNLILSQKLYDFLLYIYPTIERYPKHEKFVLQTQTKNCVLDLARQVIKANKSTTAKKSQLYEADAMLQELNTLMRLAYDLRYLNTHKYEVISGKLSEIGALLGGLIKFVQGQK
jgi:four helix bundle protein